MSVSVRLDGAEGLAEARTGNHDAIILDIMLDGLSGLEILQQLRKENNQTPVILLTALDGVEDRVRGLDGGADDYLTKPFYVDELFARLQAIVRRSGKRLNDSVELGPLSIHLVRREVLVHGTRIDLTAREFTLLEFLCRTPGNVYTRTQILECVWEYHFDPKTNIVDVYIQRLRSKLADAGLSPFIETVRGAGYRVQPPQQQSS
jgi:DNA-binding response OmpR family regulator